MKPTAVGVGIGSTWGGIGLSQSNLVPVGKNNGGGGGTPPLGQQGPGGGGGGGGNLVPCPAGCGCHPLWYIGAATGIMLLITVLLARA